MWYIFSVIILFCLLGFPLRYHLSYSYPFSFFLSKNKKHSYWKTITKLILIAKIITIWTTSTIITIIIIATITIIPHQISGFFSSLFFSIFSCCFSVFSSLSFSVFFQSYYYETHKEDSKLKIMGKLYKEFLPGQTFVFPSKQSVAAKASKFVRKRTISLRLITP